VTEKEANTRGGWKEENNQRRKEKKRYDQIVDREKNFKRCA